ncbi:MAG: TRM11 family SAM-dependent methyltransferase [Thermoprotei archaeon]
MDSPYLALEELKALAEPEEVHYLSGVALFKGGDLPKLAFSSFVKYAGKAIAVTNDVSEIARELKGECFHVKIDSILSSGKGEIEVEAKKLSSYVKLGRDCPTLDLVFTDGLILVGLRKAQRDTKSLERHSMKPYRQSGTLSADLARAAVNLSKARRAIYDPFAGLGGILIEAAWRGLECFGSDLDLKSLAKAKANLSALNYDCDVFAADAVKENVRGIEAIVTDPPYGRSTRAKASELIELYKSFFYSAYDLLPPKGRLVFITDSKLWFYDDLESVGYKVVSVSKVYEHKSLTRAFYVAERP